jgi:hypothetical protein
MRARAWGYVGGILLALAELTWAQQCPSPDPPLAKFGILQALKQFGERGQGVLTGLVAKQGVDFRLDSDSEKELGWAGVQQKLLDAIRKSYCQPPPTPELKPLLLYPPLRALATGARQGAVTAEPPASTDGVVSLTTETVSDLQVLRIKIELGEKLTFPARLLLIGPKPPAGGPALPIEGVLTVTSTDLRFLSADDNFGFQAPRKDIVGATYNGLQAAFILRTTTGGEERTYLLAHRSGKPEDSRLLSDLLTP